MHLLEACESWSRQSRRYLGRKRSERCTFFHCRLEDFTAPFGTYDLIWAQWVLQYLTDADAARALAALGRSLSHSGMLVLKENYPYWLPGESDAFAMDVPEGEHGRYDVTRPDAHHKLLFRAARLAVVRAERGKETVTWVLCTERGGGAPGSRGGEAADAVDAAAVLLGAFGLREQTAAHLEANWARRVEGETEGEFGGGPVPLAEDVGARLAPRSCLS